MLEPMIQERESGAVGERGALRARRFESSDWGWVARWFEDDALNGALGPLDLDWVEHVLHADDGVQLVVERSDGAAVALVGIAWDPEGVTHGITDFAVDPALRRSGVGRAALAAAIGWPEHPSADGWVAFVDPVNVAALGFFRSLGWTHEGIDDDMHRFTWRAP